MVPVDVPVLGEALLAAILVAASYTFVTAVGAARGHGRLLRASRHGLWGTIALIATAVFLLAYAFHTHDFRIRYVAHYSDRSMSTAYLWTALWGGQDGSLLWWSFLLSGYSLAFTLWLRNKLEAFQPYVFATLSSILAFFAITMLFAANPFAVSVSERIPIDGDGLNPLLQNYWMAIHPPALYMGLTGWAIPFSLCVGALFTGRLDDTWILAARRWTLLAWGFLTLGNLLGMFWSYEELGWGGYWAWDPVENASFMPWLLGTAYLHSVMVQERRGTLKVWNVSLMAGTFFMTIFGTFLTRSGLIASVHSFARSDIGIYFVWYMAALAVFLIVLISWRLPELRGKLLDSGDLLDGGVVHMVRVLPLLPFFGIAWLVERVRVRMDPPTLAGRPPAAYESVVSREFVYLLNNWILLGMLLFVLVSTTFPLVSEALRGETVTVGPAFYNRWMVPFALILLFLMGAGPLVAWRRASGKNLAEAFRVPTAAALVALVGHALFGASVGLPPTIESSDIYGTSAGAVLMTIGRYAPVVTVATLAFTLAAILQEFWRGTAARMRSTREPAPMAFVNAFARARRRYGGYVVHLGIVFMFLGFLGAAYDVEREGALRPGGSLEVAGTTIRYDGFRRESDVNRTMVFADMTILDGEREVARVAPAKFVYRTHPEMPTTEVAIRSTLRADLYVILSQVEPGEARGTFRVVHRPLVLWVWLGGALMLLGVFLAAFPSLREIASEPTAASRRNVRVAAATTTLALMLALLGVPVRAQDSSTLHAGTVEIHDPAERQVFERLLCECGDCARLPLSTCGCGWAETMRAEVRAQLAEGRTLAQIQEDYRERFGSAAIAVPSDRGLDRAMWVIPVALFALALPALFVAVRRRSSPPAAPAPAVPSDAALDARIDDELRELDDA